MPTREWVVVPGRVMLLREGDQYSIRLDQADCILPIDMEKCQVNLPYIWGCCKDHMISMLFGGTGGEERNV